MTSPHSHPAAPETMQAKRIRIGQLLAYILIVAVALLGFWIEEQSADRDLRNGVQARYELCLSQQEAREASRGTVREIAALGRDLARNRTDLTERFDAFERRRLAQLPLVECPIPTDQR